MEAMLGYADAYLIYNEFDRNHSQKGVCLANMGSISIQMHYYNEAIVYTQSSIRSIKDNISDLKQKYESED